METYTKPKKMVKNPHYQAERQKKLGSLSDSMIDEPIIEIVYAFNELPYCFTLQSCYGHFIHDGQKDPHSLEPLPVTNTIVRVAYKIAFIALCIEDSDSGRRLFDALQEITNIDPENIQFFSADWFWARHVNSYALQVEPCRYKHKDRITIDYEEALKIEMIRNAFFDQLRVLLQN